MAREKKNIRGSSSEDVETVFEATVQLLKKYKVSATPENYTLFYDYASGQNATVRAAIDKVVKQNGTFTEEELESIH